MNVHIISDGTPQGTQIIDMQTGNHLENIVSEVNILMSVGRNQAILTVPQTNIDIVAEGIVKGDNNGK
jgi:hypothetical protein